VFEALLDAHFRPWWESKGWRFPGLAPCPEAEAPETPAAADPVPAPESSEEPAAAPAEGYGRKDHPTVLVVEEEGRRRAGMEAVLAADGYEVRFAATLEEIRRDLERTPPAVVAIRRDGPVPPSSVLPLVRRARGTELRIVRGPAEALLGDAGSDERLPRFLFDLVRFFTGVVAATAGDSVERTEARARHAGRAARRMGLPEAEIEAVRLAAVLGDLEALLPRAEGSGQSDGILASLLDAERTPYPIAEALAHRRERFDGSGPAGLAGEAIPATARVLAAVDALLDPGDGGPEERLREQAGVALDPRAVEAVLRSEKAERIVDRLGESGPRDRVLVVEPDPVAASLLEMRLSNAGFDVELRREGTSALEAAGRQPPALVFSEVALPGLDGFTLLLRLRKEEATADVPFLFVTERADRGVAMRALELGADDVLAKPADLELLTAKAKALVRKNRARRPAAAPAGVSGDLTEMELVDLLQVLGTSGRVARVRIEGGGESGELALERGKLVDARVGATEGLDAFHLLLARREGRFTVESGEASSRTIDAPLESLLLDACRILDERSR
jgi:DNA-binding response OmpR family regulator